MVQRLQVYWISAAPMGGYQQISFLAGRNRDGSRWELSAAEALLAMDHGKLCFYILRDGRVVDIASGVLDGQRYLKCATDEVCPLQLLALPSFEPQFSLGM